MSTSTSAKQSSLRQDADYLEERARKLHGLGHRQAAVRLAQQARKWREMAEEEDRRASWHHLSAPPEVEEEEREPMSLASLRDKVGLRRRLRSNPEK